MKNFFVLHVALVSVVLTASLPTIAQTAAGPHSARLSLQGRNASVQSRFLDAPEFEAGAEPRGVIQGDFNHDGKADVVVVNRCITAAQNCNLNQLGGVLVELGNGDGTFQAPVIYAAQYDSNSAIAADFNGDGNLDLAVVNCGNVIACFHAPYPLGTVSILLGNGDGTFQPPVDYTAGYSPQDVTTADFNGDGKLDLAVAVTCGGDPYCNHHSSVLILIGNGDGTFRSGMTFLTGFGLASLVAGDFNHDGTIDIAAANCGSIGNCLSSNVSILLGNGDGTFQSHIDYPSGDHSTGIAVGDFNGDANLDLAVANYCSYNLTCYRSPSGNDQGIVAVMLGNGDGTFQPHVDYKVGIQLPFNSGLFPLAIEVSDFNGDQVADLAVADYLGGAVSILFGKGNGTFQTHVDYGAADGANGVAVGDFNGDGKPDLAISDEGDDYYTSTMSVLINNGDRTFRSRMDIVTGEAPQGVATGDFNGDGVPDLVTADTFNNTVSILLGNSTFEPRSSYKVGVDPYGVIVADFNHDGKADIAAANSCGTTFCSVIGTVSVLLGNGDGTFGQASSYSVGQTPRSLAAGDVDGDGVVDLVVGNSADSTVSILLGNGDGTFGPQVQYASGPIPQGVALADLNNDGKLDIATADQNDTVSILRGNGDGTFQPHVDYATGKSATSVAVADFNEDGALDLVTSDYISSSSGAVSILLGKGDGTFPQHTEYVTPCGAQSVAIGDFLGRKLADVVAANTTCNSVSVLLGKGDGTLQRHIEYRTGHFPTAVTVMNGTQPVIANMASNTVSVLPNLGVTITMLTSSPNPSKAGQQVTFTAKVAPNIQGGQGTPTGKVTFKSGSLMKTVNLVNGVAQFTTSQLKAGSYKFTASYAGDNFFNPSTSMTITQIVNP